MSGPMACAPRFDAYVIVDWSAAAAPKRGRDSIWIAHLDRETGLAPLENPATRAEAMDRLGDILAANLAAGKRTLAGFDFPFGWPVGAAQAVFEAPGWRALWRRLAARIEDGPDNANNRFEAADALCRNGAPFWGHPQGRTFDGLKPTAPASRDGFGFSRYRAAERYARPRGFRPFDVWQLSGAGAVGGQVLTGIPALERLRADPRLQGRAQVWPFETGFAEGDAPIVIAEVWPSLLAPHPDEPVRDAGQVRMVAETFAHLDAQGRLAAHLAPPDDLPPEARRAAQVEEGWIMGLGREQELQDASATLTGGAGPRRWPPSAGGWIRDPAEIYRRSFEMVRAEAPLGGLPADMTDLAVRVVHACGMPEAARLLRFSPGAAASGRAALDGGAPVICDAAMVAHGVIRRALPPGVEVVAAIDDPGCAAEAKRQGTTRSAAAMDLVAERLGGAIVAIGNAPTALFRLLELIDAGAPRPALILGFPVGFVGAAESKAALAADPRGAAFVAVEGRIGGSAMAAAAVNALSLGLRGDGLAASAS